MAIDIEFNRDVYLPIYQPLVVDDPTIDIEILYGGRDSGKSQFVAQKLIDESLDAPYFRCLLIKETHESIKDSQWQMLKDVAEDWDVARFYKFTESPLAIKGGANAIFGTRGMNDPGRIRSFTNPSHAWLEEANQITETGFVTLLTSMRSNRGRVKLYLTLNPEATSADFVDFWIYKWFFAKYEGQLSFTGEYVLEIPLPGGKKETVRLRYRCTHTTYHDNPFVTPQRKAFHESLQLTNPYWYRVFTEGLWGNVVNENPWAFAFNGAKHIGHCSLNRKYPLILSFDFNRNPMVCTVAQLYDNTLYCLECFKLPKTGIDGMCQHILTYYPGCLYLVTGDYTGTHASTLTTEHVSNYTMIKHYLKLSDGQIKIEPNPRLQKNQQHVNTILAFFKVVIDAVKARPLIFDMRNVKKRADGTIVKDDRNDPAQQSDALDTFRYICNIFLKNFKPPNT